MISERLILYVLGIRWNANGKTFAPTFPQKFAGDLITCDFIDGFEFCVGINESSNLNHFFFLNKPTGSRPIDDGIYEVALSINFFNKIQYRI